MFGKELKDFVKESKIRIYELNGVDFIHGNGSV